MACLVPCSTAGTRTAPGIHRVPSTERWWDSSTKPESTGWMCPCWYSGVHSALASPGKPTANMRLHQCNPARETPMTASWNLPIARPALPTGRGLYCSCLGRLHTAFQRHSRFESLCLGLINTRPPTRALFFWCISTISHFKLKRNL